LNVSFVGLDFGLYKSNQESIHVSLLYGVFIGIMSVWKIKIFELFFSWLMLTPINPTA